MPTFVLAPYRMMVPRKDGGYDTREYSLLPAGEYSKVDYLWQLTGHAAAFYYGVLWNKLYRRDLIRMAQIRFENVVFAEDQLFNTRYLQVAQRFAAIDEAAYCYIQNPQSVCHTQVSAATCCATAAGCTAPTGRCAFSWACTTGSVLICGCGASI